MSDLLGLDPRTSILGSPWRFQGFILLLSGVIFYLGAKNTEKPDLIIKTLISTSTILAIITVFQFFMLQMGQSLPNYNGRVIATLGNPNFVGAYLAICIPLSLFYIFKMRNLNYLISGFLISGVIISGSKAAIIAAAFILIYFLYKKIKDNKLIFILLICVVTVFTLASLNYFVRPSIYDTRTLIWESGINSLVKMPLTGFGQENFELIFPKELNFKVDNAHNIFLETLTSSGIIGLCLFISIIIVCFKKANPIIRISLISILICGFFNPLFINAIILFWILIGISNKEFNFSYSNPSLLTNDSG